MSYETLDKIADAFIPIAFFIAITGFFLPSKRSFLNIDRDRDRDRESTSGVNLNKTKSQIHNKRRYFAWNRTAVTARALLLTLLLALAYGLMFVDNMLGMWPFFGLDYSTHTAVYLCLSIYLSLVLSSYRYYWVFIFVSYVALMRYQEYHSMSDMCTSFLAVVSVSAAAIYGFKFFFCQAFGEIPVFFRNTRANAELSS